MNKKLNQLDKRHPNTIYLVEPPELGYQCPQCKSKHSELEWSEFSYCLWCETCQLDIPSCLCLSDVEEATEIFLKSMIEYKTEKKETNTMICKR